MRSKVIKYSIIINLLLIFVVWMIITNITIETTYYKVYSDNLPTSFDGYRIAQVSDLHNMEFGSNNSRLIKALKKSNPNIIVITGDLIDSNNHNVSVSLDFAKKAMNIADCYYVTGNHEGKVSSSIYNELEEGLISLGVTLLHDCEEILEYNGEIISLVGIDDPDFGGFSISNNMQVEVLNSLSTVDTYKILLSHRPEFFYEYSNSDYDLVLTGHAHGGQIRIPFVGGVIAPHQGFFPKYDAGEFCKNETTMIVSRGVGNSIVPIRFNNTPEVVVIELLS